MKKFILSLIVLVAAMGLNAAELNIYASGLSVSQTDGITKLTYVLNAPATTLNLKLYSGESLVQTIAVPAGTEDANYAKGSHSDVVVSLEGVPAGDYTWSLEAAAEAHNTDVEIGVSTVTIGNGTARGMAFDADPQSPYFGTMYIASNYAGGITAVSPLLSATKIVSSAASWSSTSPASPMRLALGEDGLLYVTDWSDNTPNITIVNRADNTTSTVFAADHYISGTAYTAGGALINGSISGCCIVGINTERVLYTIDEDVNSNGKLNILAYNIGTLAEAWSTSYSSVAFANTESKLSSANANLYTDGHGGFWVSQDVETTSESAPALFHVNSTGDVDWICPEEATTIPAGKETQNKRTRAALYVSPDKSLVVSNGPFHADFWNPTFTGDALTSVGHTVVLTDVTNNYNVVVDPAKNVYLLGGSKMWAYASATADNSYETPGGGTISVGYSRSGLTVDNLGTICLPYEVASGSLWGAEVYSVASATTDAGGNLQYITLSEETGNLTAGKPYFILPTATMLSCIYHGDEQTVVQPANGLVGKLSADAENVPDDGDNYILSGGLLHKVPSGVTVSFLQNKAYFDLSAYTSAQTPAPGRKTITVQAAPNNGTAIDATAQSEQTECPSAKKFIKNGHLYILRDGVVYNATGRMIR